MEQNTYKLFNHELNQWDAKKQWYMCTFFSAVMNLYYNTWIKLTEQDIEKIADEQAKAGLFDYEKWWRWDLAFNSVLRYLKNNWYKVPKLITLFNDADVIEYIRNDYMVATWISVSLKWKKEVEDWVINVKDYKLLAWKDFKHYLNLIDWWGDFKWEYLVDNYFFNSKWRPNLYECDINEVLQDIDQNVKYLFKY